MKPITLPITRRGNRYVFSIPARFTAEGKRLRQGYESREEAEKARAAVMRGIRRDGAGAMNIPASLADDAKKASKHLEGTGLSLMDAARIAKEIEDARSQSVPFNEVWAKHEDARSNKSAAYLRSLSMMRRKILPTIGDTLVSDLDPQTVEEAVEGEFPTAHGFNLAVRTLSPAFASAVRRGWCRENPCVKIDKRDTGRRTIDFLTIPESEAVLSACKDWSKDKTLPEWMPPDASGGLAAVCLMLFAGIRPAEVSRLDWQEIDLEAGTIFVRNQKAKTDRSRFIEMPDALQDWLVTVPEAQRQGRVSPPQWEKIWKVIRLKSGIGGRKDVLRKSFATYHLAGYGDVSATRSIMGHEVGDTLFSHYRGAVRKKDALAFWSIRPEGAKSAIRRVS